MGLGAQRHWPPCAHTRVSGANPQRTTGPVRHEWTRSGTHDLLGRHRRQGPARPAPPTSIGLDPDGCVVRPARRNRRARRSGVRLSVPHRRRRKRWQLKKTCADGVSGRVSSVDNRPSNGCASPKLHPPHFESRIGGWNATASPIVACHCKGKHSSSCDASPSQAHPAGPLTSNLWLRPGDRKARRPCSDGKFPVGWDRVRCSVIEIPCSVE